MSSFKIQDYKTLKQMLRNYDIIFFVIIMVIIQFIWIYKILRMEKRTVLIRVLTRFGIKIIKCGHAHKRIYFMLCMNSNI